MAPKLTLENWFCIEKLELVLDHPLTVIVGNHEAGKSAIRDAIAFALLGTIPRAGIRLRGDLGRFAVRVGAAKAVVRVELDGLGVQREVTRDGAQSLSVQWRDKHFDGVRAGQVAISAALSLDEGRALAALDAWQFLELPETEQRALLVRAVGAAVTGEQIHKLLHQRGCDDTRSTKVAEIAAASGFREAEKHAVEKRREAGRALEEHAGAPPSSRVTIGGKDLDISTSKAPGELETRIEELRKERDALLKGGAEIVGASRKMIETLEPQLAEAQAELDEIAVDDTADPAALRAEHAELAEEFESLERARDEATARLNEARSELDAATSATRPETCPLLGGECLATPLKIDKRLSWLASQRAELTRKVADRTKAFDQLTERLDVVGAKRDALSVAAQAIDDGRARGVELRAQVEDLQKQLDHCRQVLRDYGDLAPAEQAVRDLDVRISNNEAALRARVKYDADLAAYRARAAGTAELEADRTAWDAIAQAMKPTGVESDLLRELAPVFAQLANEVTGAVGVGELRISDDLDLSVLRDGTGWDPAQLSRSARLRLGIAIQHAIARLAGLPLLVIDEVDVFAGETQGQVMAALLSLSSQYSAVLALATLRTAAPRAPQSDQISLLWLRGGAVEAVAS